MAVKFDPILNKLRESDAGATSNIDDGTAQGQLAFWNATGAKWTYAEISEVFWDDTNKWLGIGTATPRQKLDVLGTIRATYTDNSIYTDLAPVSTGNLEINNSGVGTAVLKNLTVGSSTISALRKLDVQTNIATANASGYTGTFIRQDYTHSSGTMTGTQYGLQIEVRNRSAGNISFARGFFGGIHNNSTGTISNAEALYPFVRNGSSGTITSGFGVKSVIWNRGSGTIIDGYAVYVDTALNDGGGVFTNNYGLYVASQTAGINNWAIYTNIGDVRIGDDVIINGADGDKIWLGAGKDFSLYYDGTNAIINPKEVGSGYLDILGELQTDGYRSADGSAGATGSFTAGSGETVTVKNGLITSIV